MHRPLTIGVCAAWLMMWHVAACHTQDSPPARMNIVLIVADDMGWTDLGCYGSDLYRSPNIDRLADEGLRFTANYSACTVCSPTRAALMTGKYPARVRITDWIPGKPPENPKLIVPEFTKHLPHEETTIAERLSAAGYACASIGKWHLGGEAYYPEKHGFDLNMAGTDAPQPVPSYFAPYKISTLPQGPKGEYITDRLAAEAVRFIEAESDGPFFLYLPHFAVHTPIEAKRELIEKYAARVSAGMRHTNAAYAAMIDSLDQAVGRVRAALTAAGVAERTVIFFTSDNGGRVPTTSNAPLRVGKGSCHEGGVRVPLVVHWPNVTHGGTCDTPTISMDLFATIADIAGLKDDRTNVCDGVSLVPLLRGDGELAERPLFWHYPHYQHYQQGGTTPYGAIRRGDFRLIEFYDDGRVELYDVVNDIGETRDLAAERSELAAELRDELRAWRESVAAQMPTKNPKYDATRPEHTPAG